MNRRPGFRVRGSRVVIMLLVSFVSFQACAPDRTIPALSTAENGRWQEFEQLPVSHQLQMTDAQETGERLIICGTLVRREDGEPVAGERIYLYHATHAGQYEPTDPSDESTARLNGWVTTDTAGKFLVRTILPGDYGSSEDNRHIHTTVEKADPLAYDIHFKQYCSAMGTRFMNNSDQHFLADLKQSEDRGLVTFVQLEVKRHLSLGDGLPPE